MARAGVVGAIRGALEATLAWGGGAGLASALRSAREATITCRRRSMIASALLTLVAVGPATAQSPSAPASPEPGQDAHALSPPPAAAASPEVRAWPSGDGLRRELQDIGFVFRVERRSGDWLGWVPFASGAEAPAFRLGGAGTQPATTTFDFALLEAGLPGSDVDATLTAFLEVVARLPLGSAGVEQARRFVVDDLLTEPPEALEPCYVSDWRRGIALVTIDAEAGTARLQVAERSADLARDAATGAEETLDPADCAALVPAEVVAELEGASSERLTIAMTGTAAAGTLAFDPAEVTLEGTLVTLILTFENGSATEQTLTFEAPLRSTTGPVAPGDVRLIVVRQLAPGDHPFYSETDADALRGLVRIVAPSPDEGG